MKKSDINPVTQSVQFNKCCRAKRCREISMTLLYIRLSWDVSFYQHLPGKPRLATPQILNPTKGQKLKHLTSWMPQPTPNQQC